ncbi:secreted protein containing Fibronectin, type III domain protein [Candidatus Magnetomorum sp. HK-1]|nr:secreted protein containing Fibronectin, type III domain protein [Candidatus Magnetomorum sp. HK-1]
MDENKIFNRLLGLFFISFILFTSISLAEIPKTIHFQGILTDIDTKAVNGLYDMEFTLWTSDQPESSSIWKEIHENIIVHAGVYSVHLGSNTDPPIYEQVDFSKSYYIGVRLRLRGTSDWSDYIKNDEGRLQPLVSVPVAFYAYHTLNVKDDIITTSKIQNQAVTGDKIADHAISQEKIASQAITSEKISDQAVQTNHIADNAITHNLFSDSLKKEISNIDQNTQTIVANSQRITDMGNTLFENTQSITDLNNTLSTNTQSITDLNNSIYANAQSITDLNNNLFTNAQSITDLSHTIFANAQSITDLNNSIYANTQSITVINNSLLANAKSITNLSHTLETSLSLKADLSELSNKANISDVYNKSAIDSQMTEKADLSALSLKADLSALELKADKIDVYTRLELYTQTQVDELLSQKANTSDFYNQTDIDTILANKADKTELDLKADIETLHLKAGIDQIYTRDQLFTKSDIQELLNAKADNSSVYKRDILDARLLEKANQEDLSLKADQSALDLKADRSSLDLKADKSSTYTRGQLMTRNEIESVLKEKADQSSMYDRTIIDQKLSEKATIADVSLKADLTALELKADKALVYTTGQLFTRDQIQSLLSTKSDAGSVYDQSIIDIKLSEKADNSALNLKADADTVYTRGQLMTQSQIQNSLNQKADISDIYTRTIVDTLCSQKADTSRVYTRVFLDSLLSQKAEIANIYTRTVIDNALSQKADFVQIYTRSTLDSKLSQKADYDQIYTRANLDNALSQKADVAHIYTRTALDNFLAQKADQSSLDLKANITDIYSRTTIDEQIAQKADKTDLNLKADVSLLPLKADKADIYTRNQLYTRSEMDETLSKLPTQTSMDLKANVNEIYTINQLLTKTELSQNFTTVSLTTTTLTLNQIPIIATGNEINYLTGVNANIQSQMNILETTLNTKADDNNVLKKDGSVSLTADWDAGNATISARQMASTVSTGTAPLIVSSSTKVDFLNADLLDGKHAPTSGDIVGTTSSQTLTNKTLTSPTISSPNISGGSLNNTTIGVNTPSSGNFTTLSASGQTTLNGATNTGNLKTSSLTLNNVNITATGNEINYLDGVTSSIQTQLNSKASGTDTLKKDGTTSLTNDWNTGNYKITAKNFQSSASTGTSPLIVSSTTKVSNLNADLLDGKNSPGGDIVGTTDSQTLTNKTLTSPILNTAVLNNPIVKGSDSLSFEGSTDNNFETRIAVVDPTTDRTITIPNTTGTVVVTSDGNISGSQINASEISSNHIADNAITESKIMNNAVSENKLNTGAVTENKIAVNAVTENKIATNAITGTKIADNSISESKIVNSAVTTNKIADNSVSQTKIIDSAVSESKIAISAVTENKVATSAITENKIATNAVTGTKIADNSISENKIVNSAVTTNKIADNAITDAKLNITHLSVQTATISNSLTTDTGKLNDLTVSGNASIQTSTMNALTINNLFTINNSTIASSASQARTITFPDTSGVVVITEDGTIPDSSITTSKMANSAVTTDKVADSAITTVKITDNAITSSKIADNAILSNHIANGSITSADIATTAIAYTHLSNAIITAPILAGSGNAAMTNGISGQRLISNADGTFSWANPFTISDGSITFAKIEAGAISESTLADNAITENKIIDRAITENKIATNAVTGTKIADNSVSESKIVNSAVTTNKIADYSVSEAKMITGAVTTNKIADNAITDAKLNITNLSVQTATISSSLTADNGQLNALTVSGNASIQTSTINALTINNVFKISDSTIASSASQARTITLPDTSGFVVITEDGSIPDSSVTSSKIAYSAVTSDKVADNAITAVKISDNAITSTKIADNAILSNHIANGSITSADIATTAIGYTHLSNAIITAPILAASGNAAMTNGDSGQYLVSNSDGTFSWTDTFSITDGSITFAKIEAGAVSESTLADNAITVNKIADNAITENKIADNAITDAKLNITNLSVQTATISSSLTADNGQLNALTVSGNASIQTSTINALTINNVIKISDSTIASSASQARTITLPDTSGFVVITEDGSIPDSSITSSKIAYSAVTSDKVADNAITTVKIIDNAITSVKIADNAISSNHIVNASITSIDIAPSAIAYTHLNNAIITAPILAASGNAAMTNGDSGQRLVSNGDGTFSWASPFTITDGSISFAKIEAGAISESALADNAITTNKIADNAITDAKLNVTNLSVQTATISASLTADAAQLTALTVSGNASFQTSTFNTLTINNTFKMNDLTITTSTSQARDITFPDRSGFVVVTEDGNITATMLAGSGNIAMTNGTSGQKLVSNADGTFSWADAFTITDGYITSAKIADGSITASDIASKAINYTQIAEGGIKAINLSGVSDNGTDGQCLSSNGDGTFSWSSASETLSVISTDTTLITTQQGVILATNAIALTLPDASSANATRFTIKNIDSANTVRVAGDIDGQSEVNLSFQYAYVEVISNGISWYIVAQHPLMSISPPTPGNSGITYISNVAGDSATLTWTVATDDQSVNLEYRVYKSTSSINDSVWAWETNGTAISNWLPNTSIYQITGLSSGTKYTVNVIAKDEAGNKALYESSSLTIPVTYLGSATNSPYYDVKYSPDMTMLAASMKNGDIELWDLETLSIIRVFDSPSESYTYNAIFHPDGSKLATTSFSGGHVYLWNVSDGSLIGEFNTSVEYPITQYMNSISFNHDGTLLAGGGGNKIAYVWEVATLDPIKIIHDTHTGAIAEVAFNHDGTALAITDSGGKQLSLWNVDAISKTLNMYDLIALDTNTTYLGLAFGTIIVNAGPSEIDFRESSGAYYINNPKDSGTYPSWIAELKLNNDNTRVYGAEKGRIYKWDTSDGSLLKVYNLEATSYIANFDVSPDETTAVYCSTTDYVSDDVSDTHYVFRFISLED